MSVHHENSCVWGIVGRGRGIGAFDVNKKTIVLDSNDTTVVEVDTDGEEESGKNGKENETNKQNKG